MANPSITQLKRAVEISEKIEALQSELDSILGGSGSAGSAPKKRGRGPGKKAAGKPATDGAKKKRVMSPEAKAKIAEAQRKRWAKQKKAEK